MNAEQLLAHYERIAEAPDSITRLRRFVLDLAVRGKLVEQDPADEPAAKLLEHVGAEKLRLQGAGEIGRTREVTPAVQADIPIVIPSHWQPVWLLQVLDELQTGPFGSSLHQSDYRIGGTPVINPASLQNERIVPIEKMAVDDATLERLASFKLRAGDIAMARRGEMGRCAIVTEQEAGWLCGTGSLILRPSKLVFARFLVLLIGSPFSREYLGGSAVGATMQNLNQSILLRLPFGLPPLAEQHRIVAKVDELMALCDRLEEARKEREAARARLTAASLARLNTPDPDPATFTTHARFALDNLPALTTRADQIKQLRQTILNLAVRGKLAEQVATDEPASALIEKIAFGKQDTKRTGRKSRQTNDLPPFRMPLGWCSVTLDETALSMRYGTAIKCDYASQGVPVLRIPNVSSGRVFLDDLKFGPLSQAEQEQLSLRPGDLLLIRSNGSLDIVGRSAVVPVEAEGMSFAGYLVRLRTDTELIHTRYVWLALNSSEVRSQIERPIRSAVGLKNVNLTEFGRLSFLLPPLAEQHRIVAKVDELMTLCDRLEASLTTGDETRQRLLEAVLHEALEPAEVRELELAQ